MKKHESSQNDNNSVEQPENSLDSVGYLPPILPKFDYSLVIDLDETLVHFIETRSCNNFFIIRPYARLFLKKLAKLFEIIIFTSSEQQYADM